MTTEEKPKSIQRTVAFSPETWDMLMDLKTSMGQKTLTGALAQIIYDTYRKANPAYVVAKGSRETKGDREDAARKSAEAVQLDIAKRLNATIEEKGGVPTAKFYTYALRDRYEQEYSLSLLSEDMVRNQYQPSRERVEQLIKEGKTRWK